MRAPSRPKTGEVPVRTDPLGMLGLARRAGALRIGVGAVRAAIRDGEIDLVILAADGAEGQVGKVRKLASHREVRVRWVRTRLELGAAVGEGPLTAVGVRGVSFAETLEARLPDRRETWGASREESGIDAGR
jgi:ribosomal protein L7Ae-like RNA K-turn-binding protein